MHKPCVIPHPNLVIAYHYGLGPVIGHSPPSHSQWLGDGFLSFIPEETSSGGWEHINHISFSGLMPLYGIRVSFAGFNRNNEKRNTVHSVFTVWNDRPFFKIWTRSTACSIASCKGRDLSCSYYERQKPGLSLPESIVICFKQPQFPPSPILRTSARLHISTRTYLVSLQFFITKPVKMIAAYNSKEVCHSRRLEKSKKCLMLFTFNQWSILKAGQGLTVEVMRNGAGLFHFYYSLFY